jgi:hypothetical protein
MGMVFPELMANAEYARCLFVMSRGHIETTHRKVLETLGCDPRTVEAAIDLLTERQLLRYDVRSLDPKAMGPATGATEQKLRDELEQQLRGLLGEDKYDRFQEPRSSRAILRKPDGTVEERSISFSTVPTMHVETRQRGMVDVLARRLSYSDEPLAPAQREALVTALTALARKDGSQRMPSPEQWSEPELAAAFKSVLKPGQLPAVEALQAETAAFRRRSQLPKQ